MGLQRFLLGNECRVEIDAFRLLSRGLALKHEGFPGIVPKWEASQRSELEPRRTVEPAFVM
jgi:hypothetical protein